MMSAEIIQFVPRPNPNRFAEPLAEVRQELSDLVPFAKEGGPIVDHHDFACSETNPEDVA